MKTIKFLVNICPYAIGDIAEFKESLANKYIAAGYAEEVISIKKNNGK
jgi:hypothetical protein